MKISGRLLKAESIRELITFPRFLFLMILIGIIMRFITLIVDIPRYDGAFYSTIGYNVATKQDFVSIGGFHRYSFSLTYPAYLAVFYSIFGFNISVTQLASFLASVAVLCVAYLTTKNLMNKERALVVTAILALLQPLITATGKNYIENMVLLFFIPMMWAILKSFKDSRYIILASFLAGLVYYTKTDVGLPIAVGGIAAYGIWRFYHMKWPLFKDKNYYVAFIIILAMVLLRAYFVQISGDELITISGKSTERFSQIEGILKYVVQIIFHAILIGTFIIFWAPEFNRSIRDVKKEDGILLLSSLVLMIPIIFNASGYPLFSTAPINGVSREYITIIFVPLLWAFLLNKKNGIISTKTQRPLVVMCDLIAGLSRNKRTILLFTAGLFLAAISILIDDYLMILFFFGAFALITIPMKKRIILLLIALLILSANALSGQNRPAFVDAAEEINKRVESGDVIALARIEGSYRLSVDRIFPYLTVHDVTFEVYNHTNITGARFIISEFDDSYEGNGYRLVDTYNGNMKPTILKNIAMVIIGKDDQYQPPPIYLWERL